VHGATHGLSGEREVDAEGMSCCLTTRPQCLKLCASFSPPRRHQGLVVPWPKAKVRKAPPRLGPTSNAGPSLGPSIGVL
jgi:hypothetical protein